MTCLLHAHTITFSGQCTWLPVHVPVCTDLYFYRVWLGLYEKPKVTRKQRRVQLHANKRRCEEWRRLMLGSRKEEIVRDVGCVCTKIFPMLIIAVYPPSLSFPSCADRPLSTSVCSTRELAVVNSQKMY